MFNPVPFSSVTPQSSLAVRLIANYARLEGDWYRPDQVFEADKAGWPADWEGRLILGLALHAQCSGRYPAYLDEILRRVPQHLNKRGYFGKVLPEGVNDEQQMAGHSWYLRGLLECRNLGLSHIVDPLIDSTVKNLLMVSAGNYARYPLDPATRWHSPHWKLSQLQKKASTHAETSDCGCAFIMLDGATAYYEQNPSPRLRALIYEMIERYREVDFEGIHVQTHATLSALRGILRMYELDGDAQLLTLVKKMFRLYKRVAWTDAYGNFNWFGLPRWTEPCAILDSFILSSRLWMVTGEKEWLDDAHFIQYNAMAHAQRATGAFGTDTCVGPAGRVLAPITYEVTWCCTMRGAEGLTAAARAMFCTDGDTVAFPFYGHARAKLALKSGTLALSEQSSFPADCKVALTVENSTVRGPVTLLFALPPGSAGKGSVRLNGRALAVRADRGMAVVRTRLKGGDKIEFSAPLKLWTREGTLDTKGSRGRIYMHGPSILGCEIENGKTVKLAGTPKFSGDGVWRCGTKELRPLWDVRRLTRREQNTQVIF